MTTRAMGPGAGFDWLKRAINLGSRNAKAVFGAAGLLLLVALVPTILQLLVQNGMGVTDPGMMMGLMGFSLLYSLLVMPPLFVGFLRIIHGAEQGAPVRAANLFDGYRDGPWRAIGLMLLLLLIGLVLFGGILLAFGTGFLGELATAIMAMESAGSGAPAQTPVLPDGLGKLLALFFVVGVFFNGVYALSLGQVALGDRGPLGALGDGLAGTIKNLLPLVVLTIVALVLGFVLLLVLGLLIALLAVVGGLVHPVLAIALAAPVYLAAMLALYVVMFGTMYFMWRDVCGGEIAPRTMPEDSVEL